MRRKRFSNYFRKGASLLLIICLIIGLSLNGMISTASAATIMAVSPGLETPTDEESQPATEGNCLPANDTQSSQAQKMGFSIEQPARLSPSGKEVDKNSNPLGPNNLTLNRINQLALSSFGSITVYKDPLGSKRMFKDTPPLTSPSLIGLANPLTDPTASFRIDSGWAAAERSIAAADIDGNGKQEVVTAGLLKIDNGNNVALHLMVSDYNAISSKQSSDKDYTIVSSMSNPSGTANTAQALHTAAGDFDGDGKDEIAVAAGNILYLCKADLNSCQILSSATISSGAKSLGSIADVEAADVDGDGFPELLVTKTGGTSSTGTPYLYIFKGTDLSRPSAQIKLQVSDGGYLTDASVTMGDAFGNGEKTILLGGATSKGQVALTYVKFHPNTETYDTAPVASFYVEPSDFKAVKGNMDLKCASLKTPVPGTPEYVMLGGFLFLYDSATKAFVRQDVATSANTSKLDANSSSTSHGSITNVNVDKDSTYILNTLVGNFDGNTLGEEQIIVLHYNKWYGSEYVYATTCSIKGDGTINSVLLQVWKSEKNTVYTHPAIGAPDIYNQGVRLEFEPSKSTFMFSNPTVLSVLGATPYYKELFNEYGSIYNVGTSYGNESETGSSESNGVTANVGVSFGFTQGVSILGIQIGEVSFETEVTNSLAYTWTNSKSISKNISYTNYYSEDAAVVTVVPYDVYFYKVYTYDSKTQTTSESEISMNVPYSPMTTMMPIEDYNKAAQNIKNAPLIGSEVLKHTVGDPRSYPQSSSGLSNVSGTEVLLGGNSSNESENFVAAGIGNNSVEQSITTSDTSEEAFDYELEINLSYNVNLFGATGGVSAGVGYTRNATTTSTKSTIRTGSVASVPRGYEGYNFNWCLVAYNYNLQAGDSTQECTVISYLVKPIGSFPPAVPENFKVKSQTLGGNTLQWDSAASAAGYRIARSTSQSGTFTDISGNLTGKDSLSYTDSNVSSGQTYYYVVVAYAAKDSLPTDPLEVNTLSVTGISVKTQPKLAYTDGDALDLSALAITLKISNGSTQDIAYAAFDKENLTASLGNGIALTASQTGMPITLTYVPNKLTVNTNNLTVNAKNLYDLTFSVVFKVGTVNNATALAPSKQLAAAITLTNTKSSAQQVLVILALYNDKGTMVKNTYQAHNIAAKAAVNKTLKLDLPSNITDYTAKVFVWDGKDFNSTTLTPKSVIVQIPTQ